MENIYSQGAISKLCFCIIDRSRSSSADFPKFTKLMRVVCNGSEKSNISNCLMNVEVINSILRLHLSCSLQLIEILNFLLDSNVPICWNTFTTLIKKLVISEIDFVNKRNIIKKMWAHKDFPNFPVKLIISLIKEYPFLVEMYFINLYKKYITVDEVIIKEQCWKETDKICWVIWASQSPYLFSVIVSIMNQLLLHVRLKQCLIDIIGSFISNLICLCEELSIDFVQLYPLDCQAFVSFLIIEPQYNPCKSFVVDKLKLLKQKEPTKTLLLLTHFQNWIPFI